MRPYRSILFVPGHKPEWADKALAARPDAIILDLEDSVPADRKDAARHVVADTISKLRAQDESVGIGVRVNPLGSRLTGADLETVVVPGLDVVFAPKIEHPTDLLRYDALLDHFEHRNGVEGLRYIVPVETVAAVLNAVEIAAASPRVGAMIGPTAEHADIAREVGFTWTPEGTETLYLRSRVLLACRNAGIHALTGLWERIDDLDGLAEFAAAGHRLGFRGMIAIHPTHVRAINREFAASEQDIAFYRGLVAAYTDASEQGSGAVRYRGLHIDRAHYDKALEWLTAADEWGECTVRGLYFEEFEVGKEYRHPFTRTVTEMDNVLFTSLTMNLQPLHLDAEFAKNTVHRQRVVNSLFTVALVGAFHVPELTMGTTLGNLGYDEIRFPHPVFHGDTLRAETTILDKRVSKSRTDSGIVWFEHRGYNQDDVLVCLCKRVGLMMTRPADLPEEGH